ncbi:hypothetical protein WAI453_003660 [Rhynchosporium graminicola]|uniref:F-box domain-containing protein n=1 Tax=Rhynchosporium graminicola TaxID=2792576 RepID=A0A1E1JZN8_9HELO|nr:uncharacterized protein RCO7_01522 [Rhynchosporium commune]
MEGIEYTSAADEECYLLRIPKEIRLHIYRYLLIPTPTRMISISPGDAFQDDWSEDEVDDMSDEDEEDAKNTDSDSESDADMGGGSGREYITAEEANNFLAEDYEAYKKHPAILRTNKQIYNEAITMFHEEAILVVEPGDIFCLGEKPEDLDFGAAHQAVWRHNPLKGFGRNVNGMVVYDSPEIEGGLLEPHVFARFKRILFDANFDFEHTQNVELWIDDETNVIRTEDAEKFKALMKKSSIMKDFVTVIGHSQLSSLEISLEVEVMANSNMMMQEMLDESDDEADEVEDKIDKLMEVANEKCTEMFLDSGVCDPLATLDNVQSFDLTFGLEHREEGQKYKPLPRHVKMIAQMKKHIEGQFEE